MLNKGLRLEEDFLDEIVDIVQKVSSDPEAEKGSLHDWLEKGKQNKQFRGVDEADHYPEKGR